jgi:ribosomal protein L22
MSPENHPEDRDVDAAKVAEEAAEAKQEKAKVEESERAGEPRAAKKPAAKKAAAKKAPAGKGAAADGEPDGKASAKKAGAKEEAETEPPEGENAPEKQRRRRKKAEPEVAAPGSAVEAKEAAKAKPAKEPAPKAAPRAKAGAKTARRRVVSARARYVRTSARKARMVCGHLRGKSVAEARAILAYTPREVARDWSKLLESAVANAESNHELLQDDLIVREAYADEGPTIKRFRPRAMGRATPIRKRTSHLTITLTAAPENGSGRRKG